MNEVRAGLALRAIVALANDHTLVKNAEARAMYEIARRTIEADPSDVLDALDRLQQFASGTRTLAKLVDDLVAAMAADTTVADLRQELEFVKAECAR